MSTYTTKERAWVKKLQKVLSECPSERIGFYTIGDPAVTLYDKDELAASGKDDSQNDFGYGVTAADADFGSIIFPSEVHSVAG